MIHYFVTSTCWQRLVFPEAQRTHTCSTCSKKYTHAYDDTYRYRQACCVREAFFVSLETTDIQYVEFMELLLLDLCAVSHS